MPCVKAFIICKELLHGIIYFVNTDYSAKDMKKTDKKNKNALETKSAPGGMQTIQVILIKNVISVVYHVI